MTLSPDDLAAMGERHQPKPDFLAIHDFCRQDGQLWPCDSRRLLDEVEALKARVPKARLEAGVPDNRTMSGGLWRKEVEAPEVTPPST